MSLPEDEQILPPDSIGGNDEGNGLARATRRALRERGWSLRRAELQTGVKYSTIYNMTLGREVGGEYLIRFALAVGDDPNRWLRLGGKDYRVPSAFAGMSENTMAPSDPERAVFVTPLEETLRLPLIGRIAAGTPILAERNIEEFVVVPRRWVPRGGESNCYALTVRGDSMTGADIHNGDVLAVRPVETAEDGQVVVVRIGEEVTVKRLRYRLNRANRRRQGWLYSDPEVYMDPIPLGPDAAVIGLPVGYLRQKPAAWG